MKNKTENSVHANNDFLLTMIDECIKQITLDRDDGMSRLDDQYDYWKEEMRRRAMEGLDEN